MPQFKKVQKSITIEINDLANVNLILSAQIKFKYDTLSLSRSAPGTHLAGFDCDDVIFASLPYGKVQNVPSYVGGGGRDYNII